MPDDRAEADPQIVLAAAKRRYDSLHLPVLESILKHGLLPGIYPPITMTKQAPRYLVVDGKNRCSILAAMGWENVSNVEVDE
jgi:hypothetical protein